MSDNIPSEVYREILLLLPADSLFRFRSVCKAWRHLIDSPSFVKSHTNKCNQLSSPNSNTLLIRKQTGAPLYLVNLNALDFTKSDRQLIDAIHVKQLIRPGIPHQRDLPAAPCNGLILISSDNIKKIWAIWNPLTRDCHKLPPPPDADRVRSCGHCAGLWYDYDADDYRVVRVDLLVPDRVFVFRTLVYSLKLGYWRRIRDCPYDIFPLHREGVLVNNAFHWDSKDMICVLDVGTEDYRQLALPPGIETIKQWHHCHVGLDASGGRLTLTLSDHTTNRFTGWVMKDYGGAWVKLFALDVQHFGDCAGKPTRLVTYLESKMQVLLQLDRGFMWYDVGNDDVKQITIHGLTRISSSQICPGSLYRLDDRGGSAVSGNVGSKKRKRKRTNKRANIRLKFCVRDCDSWSCSDFSCVSTPSCSEGEE